MDIYQVLIVVIVFCVILYAVNNFFELTPRVKGFVNLVLLLFFLLWFFGFTGIFYGHHALTHY
jgi:hypothetical protein